MKRIIAYIRRKLSVRVSLWIVFFAAIIFNVALGFLFYQAREAVRQDLAARGGYLEPCRGGFKHDQMAGATPSQQGRLDVRL